MLPDMAAGIGVSFPSLARFGKSCRLRWMNYLRPNVKRGNFSKEEEETIIRLHESLGNIWSVIPAELPGRTYNEVKNHWHTTLKKWFKQKPSSTTKDGKDNKENPKKEETKLNNNKDSHLVISFPNPPLILESSLSPPQPASRDQNSSSVTSDDKFDSISDDNSNSNLFEAYEVDSGSFWTEPFFSDNYYMWSDMSVPFEAGPEFPSLDDGEIF